MHPAPSLVESFPKQPKSDDRGSHVSHHHDHRQPSPPSPRPISAAAHRHHLANGSTNGNDLNLNHLDLRRSTSLSPTSQDTKPVRKDTSSSISTTATDMTSASTETSATNYSVESSQSIFSIKDGSEISNSRRASRRRTGPLSAQQREKAALIRKLGACVDCRRRRVACHPNHHNLTWEDAMRKYRASSPLQDLAPLVGRRPISPAPNHGRPSFGQESQEMDIDSTPPLSSHSQTTPGRGSISEARVRTPLPSGPRIDRHFSTPSILSAAASQPQSSLPPALSPNIDAIKADLEGTAERVIASPHRNRYSTVSALLLYWQDDESSADVITAINELGDVFRDLYNYKVEAVKIPSAADGCTSPFRWLSRVINDFTENNDTRESMKLVYYNGYSFLDENREMFLASSRDRDNASTIKWSAIQQVMEEAISDMLIIMDSAYYPSSKMVRQKGVLELVAASASEQYFDLLDRSSFTRTLAEQLKNRAAQPAQRPPNPLSAAELHSKLLSLYPKIIRDRNPDKENITDLPSPLHMQISGSAKLPSITLSPNNPRRNTFRPVSPNGPQLSLSIKLSEETLNLESWTEWLQVMPEGIKELKIQGPYTTTLRS